MDDLISRQAAIDVADAVWSVTGDKNVAKVWDQIKDLPSAQPVVISKSENATECEDAVSREAVLNEIHRYMEERDYTIGLLDDNVCGLPSVTPKQPGWIPCTTETMPKNKSYVLTVIYIPGRQAHIRSGWYEDGLFMNDNGDTWNATDKEVVGWMYQPKLPTPYREGKKNG